MKITTRNDGMLSIVLVWGRTNPTIIAGATGAAGDIGEEGKIGLPGKDGQCTN